MNRKNVIRECKNSIVKQFLMDFCIVFMKELNNYDKRFGIVIATERYGYKDADK